MTTAVETARDTPFTIGGRTFQSRLMVGTGKYRDNETMVRAIDASGADIVTVAVRRANLNRSKDESAPQPLPPKRPLPLSHTTPCHSAHLAVPHSRLRPQAGIQHLS